jgi:hypothetical protein
MRNHIRSEASRKSGHCPSLPGSRRDGACAPCERIFLVSPANVTGLRAKALLEGSLRSDLAARLHGEGAPLGEIFSFISGLYFRGKLAYARAFASRPAGVPGVLVITACGGLVSPDKAFNVAQLRKISSAPIDPREPRYRKPLLRDAQRICDNMSCDCEVVLLGSIATPKYVEPLLGVFGERLLFPAEFVGRGDMSRGGMMLRSERAGVPLNYIPVSNAVLHGPRPARLPKPAAGSAAPLAASGP